MKHYDILIATPGSTMEAQYVKSLVATLAECNKRKLTYTFLNAHSSLIHHARELTASGGEGLQLDPDHKGPMGDSVTYNKIFWIDSDIFWEPWQFFQLYDSKYDVCTGAYLLADGITTSVHAWEKPGGIPKDEILKMNKPLKVQSIGFGFVAIKFGVFEKLERPWFKHYLQNIEKSDGTMMQDSLGEDISWCINAYKAGVDIYFDPNILVNHIKKISVIW